MKRFLSYFVLLTLLCMLMFGVTGVSAATSTGAISVSLAKINSNEYNIVLESDDSLAISCFSSAALDIRLTNAVPNVDRVHAVVEGMNYVTAVAPRFSASGLYEFTLDGSLPELTGTELVIGKILLSGYGNASLALNETGIVSVKTVGGTVNTFVLNPKTNEGRLTVANASHNIQLEHIKQALTVNIDFPNPVLNNAVSYQKMKLTVQGGDLYQPIVVDLGSDPVLTGTTDAAETNADDDVVSFLNNTYQVVLNQELSRGITYNVIVSGAGYRTAYHMVTMTGDKVLNFWNNVMSNKQLVESGTDMEKLGTTTTFLAGDILGDDNINLYDLSAVVSYFSEIAPSRNEAWDKAIYDLNRDGSIDSKDVAYVLVSWNQ